jgi:hypothetical protein
MWIMASWLTQGDDPNSTLQFGEPLKNLILRGKKVRDDVAKRMTIGQAYTPAAEFPNHILFGFEPAEEGFQYPMYIVLGSTMVSKTIDPDTGAIRTTTRSIVAAGTNAVAIDSSGNYTEVESINADWMVQTVREAAGIAGDAVSGLYERVHYKHVRYYWPPVLAALFVRPVYADPADAFSAVTGFIVYPVWQAYGYSGPCKATITERWTSAKPTFDGNSNWPSGGGVPYLATPTVLLPRPLQYNGVDFNVSVESCLHGAFIFYEQGFTWSETATPHVAWPATIVADVDVRPYLGGWMTTTVVIDAPSTQGVASALSLTWAALSTTSVTLSFAAAGAGTTLDVSTAPDFSRGFLLNNVSVTTSATTYTVTGLTRGQQYYARIKLSGVNSNTVQFMAQPEPEIRVQNGGTVISSGGTNTQSTTVLGSDADTLTIYNDGVLPLLISSIELTGTNADQWTLGAAPTSVAVNDSETLSLTFSPTSSGSKAAALYISSDDPQSPHLINLAGTVLVPEINVKYSGTSYPSGDEVFFSGTTTVGLFTDYTLTIENLGTASLTVTADALTGDFAVQTNPGSPVAAGGSTTMVVRYTPGAPGTTTELLTLQNNDENEDPYEIFVKATGV